MNHRRSDAALKISRMKHEREQQQRTMKKEDFLLKQSDEFRETARQLQTL